MIISIDLSLDNVWNLCCKTLADTEGEEYGGYNPPPPPFEFQKIAKNQQQKPLANTEEKRETFK